MSVVLNPANFERLLDTKDLSEVFKLSEATIEKMRSEGRGVPYVRIGRAVRYRPSDVSEFIAASTEGGH